MGCSFCDGAFRLAKGLELELVEAIVLFLEGELDNFLDLLVETLKSIVDILLPFLILFYYLLCWPIRLRVDVLQHPRGASDLNVGVRCLFLLLHSILEQSVLIYLIMHDFIKLV
jgi:hypothetical protein